MYNGVFLSDILLLTQAPIFVYGSMALLSCIITTLLRLHYTRLFPDPRFLLFVLHNTILSQPYRRRVSTDRLNCEGSQLAASLEGEPGPTPAGKTLSHSYPEIRFQRERARDV